MLINLTMPMQSVTVYQSPCIHTRLLNGHGELFFVVLLQARKAARGADTEEPPIPITVRQLEALVRISESLARMQLQAEATEDHVKMAYELFEASTLNAINAGLTTIDLTKHGFGVSVCVLHMTTQFAHAALLLSQ